MKGGHIGGERAVISIVVANNGGSDIETEYEM